MTVKYWNTTQTFESRTHLTARGGEDKAAPGTAVDSNAAAIAKMRKNGQLSTLG